LLQFGPTEGCTGELVSRERKQKDKQTGGTNAALASGSNVGIKREEKNTGRLSRKG